MTSHDIHAGACSDLWSSVWMLYAESTLDEVIQHNGEQKKISSYHHLLSELSIVCFGRSALLIS